MPRALQKTCDACLGRRVVPNPATRSMDKCPVCNGDGSLEPDYLRLPIWYAIFNGTLLANAQNTPWMLSIADRADFEWVWSVRTRSNANGFSTTMVDQSGRTYDNGVPVNDDNRFGTAQLPWTWPVPIILPAKSQLTGLINNLDPNNPITIQAFLVGYELYPPPPAGSGVPGAPTS